MADVRHLAVSGQYSNLQTITTFVGEAALAAGLGEAGVFHCQIAVDEACTNVIEHAYEGEGKGTIEITCQIEPGLCQIVVEDHGRPFDPTRVPEHSVSVDIDQIQPGGIGLHLMRRLMDEVQFDFIDGKNRLTMIKRAPAGDRVARGDMPVFQPEPGISVVSPAGRLDASVAAGFENTLLSQLDQPGDVLIVDMSLVTYISSRGLKALVAAWRSAREIGGELAIVSVAAPVASVLETVGFTQIFSMYGSTEEALANLRARQV